MVAIDAAAMAETCAVAKATICAVDKAAKEAVLITELLVLLQMQRFAQYSN